MEKKQAAMVTAFMVLLLISANMGGVKSDASDCYDACSTACVNPQKPDRERVRCERKCSIRCSPGVEDKRN